MGVSQSGLTVGNTAQLRATTHVLEFVHLGLLKSSRRCIAMASNLIVMASNLEAMASKLLVMASTLIAI